MSEEGWKGAGDEKEKERETGKGLEEAICEARKEQRSFVFSQKFSLSSSFSLALSLFSPNAPLPSPSPFSQLPSPQPSNFSTHERPLFPSLFSFFSFTNPNLTPKDPAAPPPPLRILLLLH